MDDESKSFLLKVGIVLLVTIVVAIFLIITFNNKTGNFISDTLQGVYNEDTFIVVFTSDKCKNCKAIISSVENRNIEYYEYNIDRERDFDDLIFKFDIDKNLVVTPGLVYVKNGKLSMNVMNASLEDANNFLDNINLG